MPHQTQSKPINLLDLSFDEYDTRATGQNQSLLSVASNTQDLLDLNPTQTINIQVS